MKVEQDRFDAQARSLQHDHHSMLDGIDDFEQRLRASKKKKAQKDSLPPARRSNFIDGPETAEEMTERLQNSVADSKTMYGEAQEFLRKVQTKKTETSDLQNARARRRRQFIAEQRASQQESEDKRLLALAQEDLLKGACVEEQLGVDLWKVRQYKAIMEENRNYREVQYAERRAQDHVEALDRDSAACQVAVRRRRKKNKHKRVMPIKRGWW
jgi:hypothetical protein